MPNDIHPDILAVLEAEGSVIANGFFYLVDVELRSGTRYWDKRGITASDTGHTYEARITNISDIAYAAGTTDQVTLTVSNVDGLLTSITQSETLYGAKVTIWRYVPDAERGHVVWVGWLEEITEIGAQEATLTAYSGLASMNTIVPRGQTALTCRHQLGTPETAVFWKSNTLFDGADCTYQLNEDGTFGAPSTRGFVGTLVGDIDASETSITIDAPHYANGQRYIKAHELRIGSEKLLIFSSTDNGDGTFTLTVARGWRSSTPAAHTDNDTVFWANCLKTTVDCGFHGLYGNNPDDVVPSTGRKRNNYGGIPIFTGYAFGKFRSKQGQKPVAQRVYFGSNDSGYEKRLPLIYGRARINDPILIMARPEGDFLSTLWAVCEGTLATNPNNNSQTDPRLAYLKDPGQPNTTNERYIRVNGALRHDRSAEWSGDGGLGIQISNGEQDHIEPGAVFFPSVHDLVVSKLPLWGIAWVAMRIDTKNHPSVDLAGGGDISAAMGIAYGRLVRMPTGTNWDTEFEEKPTTNPAWVLSDVMASRRAGGGIPYGELSLASFYDFADFCDELVTDTTKDDGSEVKRYTFNGLIEGGKPFDEQVALICMGAGAARPFRGADGRFQVKPLRAIGAGLEDVPVFTDKDSEFRNILVEGGESTLRRFRRRRRDQIPNRIRANYVRLSDPPEAQGYKLASNGLIGASTLSLKDGSGTWKPGDVFNLNGEGNYLVLTTGTTSITFTPAISRPEGSSGSGPYPTNTPAYAIQTDFGKVQFVLDDEASQTLASGARNIVEKVVDLPGCSTLDEAARRATLILRIGEFGEGGLSNNEGIRFTSFVRTIANCAVGDVIAVESDKLDPVLQRYWRITKLIDRSYTLPTGGLVFKTEVEAMLHDDSLFDDSAFTVTSLMPIDSGGPLNGEPPAVTDFDITEEGVVDANGKPAAKMLIVYTEPEPRENFRSVILMHSKDDGSGDPAGDWRLVTELTSPETEIEFPVTGKLEHFAAISRPLSGHLPNPKTMLGDGSYKYPRFSVLVDGMADSPLSAPTGLQAFGRNNQIFLTWNPPTGTDKAMVKWYNVYRSTVNSTPADGATPIGRAFSTYYIDASDDVVSNPTTVYYYWLRAVSKLDGAIIDGVTQTGLSAYSSEAHDNAGTDTGEPDPPEILAKRDVADINGNFTFIVGVDAPDTPENWDTVESFRIQIATDPGFSSIVYDETLGLTRPPWTVRYEVLPKDAGVYHFRALVTNTFGDSDWSETYTASTNLAMDTDIMPAPSSVTFLTKGGSNDLRGDEMELAFYLSDQQDQGYWGWAYMAHDDDQLPEADIDEANSSYDVGGGTGTGNLTVGSNVLTDATKSFPTTSGGLVGRRVAIFSTKRPLSGAGPNTGLVDVVEVEANTATTLTLEKTMRLSGTNIQYYVLDVSGKTVGEKVKQAGVIPDYRANRKTRKRSLRIATAQRTPYVWVWSMNLLGDGHMSGPHSVSLFGLQIGQIPGDGENPTSPSTLSGSAAFRSIFLRWENAGEDDIVATEVWSSTTNNRSLLTEATAEIAFPGHTYIETSLPSNTTKYFWIRHRDKDGHLSGFSPSSETGGFAISTLGATIDGSSEIIAASITADQIDVASLFALDITATGSIIGANIKTAEDGARIEANSSGGLSAYDDSEELRTNIPVTGPQAGSIQVADGWGMFGMGSAAGTSFTCASVSAQIYHNNNLVASFSDSGGFNVLLGGVLKLQVDDGFVQVAGGAIFKGDGSELTDLNADEINDGMLLVTYGGTGADNVADARDNLDVYSRAEVDSAIAAAIAAKSDLHHTHAFSVPSTPHSGTTAAD